MEKAHVHEAILVVNGGIDEAVRGLKRLKPMKASRLMPAYFHERIVLFEEQRAQVNAYFCEHLEHRKELDTPRFERLYAEYCTLDPVQVYQDVQAVEKQRRVEGKASRVRFFTEEERQAWERRYPKPPGALEGARQ